MRRKHTIDPDYFERLYLEKGDPWEFASSPYEREKYDHSLQALSRPFYSRALEIGCSIGVFTGLLAPRCGTLLAVDVSETALAAATERCAGIENVTFARRRIPGDPVEGRFDLIVLSEVAYYWDGADLARAAQVISAALDPGADLLLVHYTAETDYPLSGDEAVEALRRHLGSDVRCLVGERRDLYRLDLWRRSGGDIEPPPAAV
jgi:SAM-dependent methyltransferase